MKKTKLPGFRIYRYEPLPETFKRVILEQLNHSLSLSAGFSETPDFTTHEIRKSTKRARAVCKLFRQTTNDELYQSVNNFFGNLSQLLAEHRGSRALMDTLQLLKKEKKTQVISGFIGELNVSLEDRHKNLTKKLFNDEHTDALLAELLTEEIKSIAEAPFFSCDFQQVASGLRKTYGRCRSLLKVAIEMPTTENLHNLRKTVKALWNQYILLRPVWPSYIGAEIHQLDLLAQKLGQEHDLAELERFIRENEIGSEGKQLKILLESITWKRLQQQKTSKSLAARLFADKPTDLGRKIGIYYGLFINKM